MSAASKTARPDPTGDRSRTAIGWPTGGGDPVAVPAPESAREGYETGARLGGSPGEVYEASHARLPGRFAIKFLTRARGASAGAIEDFQAEAEQVAVLRHPNIAEVIELGVTPDGTPIVVMEHLQGRNLEETLVNRGPMHLSEVLPVVRGIATGLEAAHGAGVVHREIRPDNVYIAKITGYEQGFVKLLDFGVSRLNPPGPAPDSSLTAVTARYLAPEQARGGVTDVDARTDQYSLAALTYRMLSGTEAFTGNDVISVLYHVLHDAPPPLTAIAGVDSTVEAVIRKAMSRDKRLRFDSVFVFVKSLEDAASGGRNASRPAVVSTPAPAATASSSFREAETAVLNEEPTVMRSPERSDLRASRPHERSNSLRDSLTERFFSEGERKAEQGTWTAADLDDERPPGLDEVDSFDRIPRRRWPMVVAVAVVLVLIPVAGSLWPDWRLLFSSRPAAFWSESSPDRTLLPTTLGPQTGTAAAEPAPPTAAGSGAKAAAQPPAQPPTAAPAPAQPPTPAPAPAPTPAASKPAAWPPAPTSTGPTSAPPAGSSAGWNAPPQPSSTGATAPAAPAAAPANNWPPPSQPSAAPAAGWPANAQPSAPAAAQPAAGWSNTPPPGSSAAWAPAQATPPAAAPATRAPGAAPSVPLRGYVWSAKERRLVPAQ